MTTDDDTQDQRLTDAGHKGFTLHEATETEAGRIRGVILDAIAMRVGQVPDLHPRLLEGIEVAARVLAARSVRDDPSHTVHVTAKPIAEDVVWCDDCEEWVMSGDPAEPVRDDPTLREPEPDDREALVAALRLGDTSYAFSRRVWERMADAVLAAGFRRAVLTEHAPADETACTCRDGEGCTALGCSGSARRHWVVANNLCSCGWRPVRPSDWDTHFAEHAPADDPTRQAAADLTPLDQARADLIKAKLRLTLRVEAACPGSHRPVQHRDGLSPWCPHCRRFADGKPIDADRLAATPEDGA